MFNLLLYSVVILDILLFSAVYSMDNYLKLYDTDVQTTRVVLPFKYRSLTEDEKTKVKFVPEWCYTRLQKDELAHFTFLCPCQAIVVYTLAKPDTIYAFHQHLSSDINSLITIANKKLLSAVSRETIRIKIFTMKNEQYEARKYTQGRSQQQEVALIKNKLIEAFSINKEQIDDRIFTPIKNQELGDYYFADFNILIDASARFFSCCGMKEGLFSLPPDISNLPPTFKASNFLNLIEVYKYRIREIAKQKKFFTKKEEYNDYGKSAFAPIKNYIQDIV